MSQKKTDNSVNIPQPTPPPYATYSDQVLSDPANYGILEQLEGTWVNYNPNKDDNGWGLHTTCMPSPGTNTETIFGVYHFLCENLYEELTFKAVPGGVRNRGGTNEQFNGAIEYKTKVYRASDDGLLHAEDGMYLWTDAMYNHPANEQSVLEDNGYPEIAIGDGASGPNFVPPYLIARSGTIPHGSSILLTGNYAEVTGKPEYPNGTACWAEPFVKAWPSIQVSNPAGLGSSPLAISPTMGAAMELKVPGSTAPAAPLNLDQPAPDWAFDTSFPSKYPDNNLTYFQRIVADKLYPYSVRPDLRLRDAIKDQNITNYSLIQLTSKHETGPQGGVLNTPFVQTFANVTEMGLNMWIQTVEEDGKKVLQLQYEQIVYFEFMFGSTGGTTRWPHIQVNTLRKKEDIK